MAYRRFSIYYILVTGEWCYMAQEYVYGSSVVAEIAEKYVIWWYLLSYLFIFSVHLCLSCYLYLLYLSHE